MKRGMFALLPNQIGIAERTQVDHEQIVTFASELLQHCNMAGEGRFRASFDDICVLYDGQLYVGARFVMPAHQAPARCMHPALMSRMLRRNTFELTVARWGRRGASR